MTGTLIPTFQARLTDALKSEGLIPMSAGVTAAVPTAGSYPGVFATLSAQVDKAQSTYGSRLTDRYSTSVGDSYRDQRYNLIAGFEGVKTRAYDDNGKMAIGLGFQMDSPPGQGDVVSGARQLCVVRRCEGRQGYYHAGSGQVALRPRCALR